MKSLFRRLVRILVVPVLLVLGVSTGGADGIVGWFVLGWMLWRGGPAMWQDVKNALRWFRGAGSLRFGRRASVHGADLNV